MSVLKRIFIFAAVAIAVAGGAWLGMAHGPVDPAKPALGVVRGGDRTSLNAESPIPALQLRKKVILVQGIGTSLQPGEVPARFAALYQQLTLVGYAASDILFYSYAGGNMQGSGWVPNAYGCADSGQATVTSRQRLRDMISQYRSVNPATTFYIVGHSLGGFVSFTTLGEVVNGNIPAGAVGKVITVDSPLEGVNSTSGILQTVFNLLPTELLGCYSTFLQSSAANEMIARSTTPGVRESNTTLAVAAGDAGVAMATFGNIGDCLYNVGACVPGGSNEAYRQLVYNSGAFVKLEDLGTLGDDTHIGHGSYLSTAAGSQQIANQVGPQVSIPVGGIAESLLDTQSQSAAEAGGAALPVVGVAATLALVVAAGGGRFAWRRWRH